MTRMRHARVANTLIFKPSVEADFVMCEESGNFSAHIGRPCAQIAGPAEAFRCPRERSLRRMRRWGLK
ncbi:MAG: hypothetical protein OEL88_08965 [Sterolibacteriaceae bacterium MAG5]|nr:hypothetical protein [Candidatus Nitricoxidireducens bremensis]